MPLDGPAENENSRSLVLLVEHAGHTILLTGDLEGPGLERALEADPKFAAARGLYAWSLVMLVWGGFSNDTGLFYKAEEEARAR